MPLSLRILLQDATSRIWEQSGACWVGVLAIDWSVETQVMNNNKNRLVYEFENKCLILRTINITWMVFFWDAFRVSTLVDYAVVVNMSGHAGSRHVRWPLGFCRDICIRSMLLML